MNNRYIEPANRNVVHLFKNFIHLNEPKSVKEVLYLQLLKCRMIFLKMTLLLLVVIQGILNSLRSKNFFVSFVFVNLEINILQSLNFRKVSECTDLMPQLKRNLEGCYITELRPIQRYVIPLMSGPNRKDFVICGRTGHGKSCKTFTSKFYVICSHLVLSLQIPI